MEYRVELGIKNISFKFMFTNLIFYIYICVLHFFGFFCLLFVNK